jgi:hypothetical protein
LSYEELKKELELQLERFIQLKDRLDNKANNMIAMSGTIATLFMGFGAFLLSNVIISQTNLLFVTASAITLMIEVTFTILTIRHALNSYKLRNYYHPFGSRILYDNNGNFDLQRAQEFINMQEPNMVENLVYNYSEAVKSYSEQNDMQTSGINNAQKTFKIALVAIPIFTFLIVLIKYLD